MLKPKKLSLMSGGVALLFGNVGYTFFSLISGIIISRIFGPEGRGIFALYFTTVSMLFLCSNAGVNTAAVYFMSNGDNTSREVLSNSLGFGLLVTPLATLILFIICPFTSNYWNGIPMWLLVLLGPTVFLTYAQNAFNRIHAGLFLTQYTSTTRLLQGVSRLGIVLCLVCVFKLGITGALLAIVGEMFIASSAGVYLAMQHIKVKISFNFRLIYKFIKYGIQFWLFMLLANTMLIMGIYFLRYFKDSDSVGIFAVGKNLAWFLQMIPDAWVILLLPLIARDKENKSHSYTMQICRNGLLALFLCGAILAIIAPFVVPFIYGKEFSGSVIVMWIAIPGLVIMHVYRTLAVDFSGRKMQIYPIIASFLGLITVVGLNFILIPSKEFYGGYIGASISLLCASLVMSLTLMFIYKIKWNIKIRDLLLVTVDDLKQYHKKTIQLKNKIQSYLSKGNN